MEEYKGTIYRPPVEANTLLLPITEGCSHNNCSFCNMYKDVNFRMLPLNVVEEYLKEISFEYGSLNSKINRIYLVGADPFALSAKHLEDRILLIKKYLPDIKTVTMYARVTNIKSKSNEDLIRLKELGVNDLYVGTECGLDDVLKDLNKGNTVSEAIEQCLRLNKAGINHRDLLMLGTAGKNRGAECAIASAEMENKIKPDMSLINTMSAFAGTKLDEEIKEGKFIPAGEKEILTEEKIFLENLNLPDTYFWAVHPLDSVKIEGIIRENKERMLAKLSHNIENIDESRINRVSRTGTL